LYFLFVDSCSDGSKPPSICLKGTYSTAGQTVCTNCSKGFKCPSDGMDTQTACGNATYADQPMSVECKTCPAGYACPRTDQDPVECTNGKYSLGGSSECDICLAGHR
jgi:hypothetical protein